MAVIDFPSSPTIGQIHTQNDLSWIWTGVTWDIYSEYPNKPIHKTYNNVTDFLNDQANQYESFIYYVISNDTYYEKLNSSTGSLSDYRILRTALLSNVVTGTGSNGQITYWNSTSGVTGSNNLFWDNTNGRLGLNNIVPSYTLDVSGTTRITGNLEVDTVNNGSGDFLTRDVNGVITRRTANEVLTDIGAQPLTTGVVTGSGVAGQVTFWNSTSGITGDNSFYWDNTNKRLGINTTTPSDSLDVSGTTRIRTINNGNGDFLTTDINGVITKRSATQTLLDIDAVPYTGATKNVNLGEFGLRTGNIIYDTTPTNIPTAQGSTYWDDAKSTLALIMNGTIQHIGQDTYFYVKNLSGSPIAKGICVRFAGTDGASGHILIEPFLANGTYPSTYFMGVTSEAISNGDFGQVQVFGELRGINTSGYTAGALLYASTTVAGQFQTTVPTAPNNIVLVAVAVNSKNNGEIIIRPTIGSNINNDEGVRIVSGTTGQLLQLQSNGLWENKSVSDVLGSLASKWTDTTGGIYRNGAVAIGRTTIPSSTMFSVQNLSSVGGSSIFSLYESVTNGGERVACFFEDGSIRLGFSADTNVIDGFNYKGKYSDVTRVFRILNSSNQELIDVFGNGQVNSRDGRWNLGTFGFPANGLTVKGSVATSSSIFRLANSNDVQVFNISGNGLVSLFDGGDIILGTTTGTKIGTATTQKIGFFNATPIVQPSGDILTALSNLGLVASPTISGSNISDAVLYTAQTKTASEKNQARINIGLTSSTPQIITTAGAINDLAVTSNSLVFTGASVVLSGIVAGLDGEEITILNASGTNLELLSESALSTAGNRFASGVIVPNLSIVRIKYRTTTTRWVLENVGINDARYVRKDVADTKEGLLTLNGGLNMQTAGNGNVINAVVQGANNTGHTFGEGGIQAFRVGRYNANPVLGRGVTSFENAAVFNNSFYVCSSDLSTNWGSFSSSTGRLIHSRSGASNESVRRDELYINYSETIATAGTINDLAINASTKLLILTAATDLTGVIPVDDTRLLRIEARGASRIIRNESTSSTATNRFSIGSDLTINNGEVYQFIYTNSRWRYIGSMPTTSGITGTGTINYLPKFTGTSTIGNSIITDDSTTVSIAGNLSLRALSGTTATHIPVFTADPTSTTRTLTTRTPAQLLNDIGASPISHTQSASSITSGTFSTGNYIFPDNLTITDGLFYVNNTRSVIAGTETYNLDMSTEKNVCVFNIATSNSSLTINFNTNPSSSVAASWHFVFVQSSTASSTLNWNTSGSVIKWAGGTKAALGAANEITVATIIWVGNQYLGVVSNAFS